MNRQRLALFLLLVVLALSLVYSYFRMPRQQTVNQLKHAPSEARTGRGAPRPSLPADDGRRVRLDLMECRQGRFAGFRRNLFTPIFHAEGKVTATPVLPVPVPPPPASMIPKAPVPPVAAPPEPPPVVRDMARFTFLGYLQKDNRKTIFLSKDKEILLVRQGDKLAGKYEATSVTDTALTIRVLSDGSEIVIPLVENRPLVAQVR
ncbi:type II secretion system protein PulP [Geobacter sp.]|uniref:type II secretion system protein PulP n=1 Tax=Geobacter sp. TaxID=46610 RepID=UPI002635E075|nr:type II secretion system protein PulP [Geobacter sp.]